MSAPTLLHLASSPDARLAQDAEIAVLRTRVKTLERTVRRFLSTDVLTPVQRDELILALASGRLPDLRGAAGKVAFSDVELALIASYRKMSTAQRSALRTICEAMAQRPS
jgi:hypothetical protein